MERNLFGDSVITEENITFIYKGDSFLDGKVLLKPLYTELKSLENLLRDSVNIFVENGKLDKSAREFEIYIEIEKGSIFEKIKVVFRKPTGIAILGSVIGPFLVATYSHFLNGRNTSTESEFFSEIMTVERDQDFKNNLAGVLSPLGNQNDTILINNGTINITIDRTQRTAIEQNLEENINIDEAKKNGDFHETLTGVIRKIDLDATHNNYLGFNIEGGQSRIPTSIQGEFNLLAYKDAIDVPIKANAVVKYKNDQITHIEIIELEILNTQGKLEI